jgi:hypothetical protein
VPRLLLAARLLFYLAAPILAAAIIAVVVAAEASEGIAELLLVFVLDQIDPDSLAGLPPDFLTADTVRRAAVALAAASALIGAAQVATAIGLRRGARWAFSAAVIGGLFVAFAAGASALFMVVAIGAQPQAAAILAAGAVVFGVAATLYAAIAVLTAFGRREVEVPGA